MDARIAETRDAVRRLTPVNHRERLSQAEVLRGLDDLADPFGIDAQPTHVTGSALIAAPEGVVLLLHKRLGIWVQPGGHVDGQERPYQAALRESVEETGLPVRHYFNLPRLVHVDAHDGGRGHRHLDLRYLLSSPVDAPSPGPEESQECRWFSWEDATAIADLGVRSALVNIRPLVLASI